MTEEKKLRQKILSLQSEIQALKEENEALTNKAEDFLLLGIISEKINLAKSIEDVIDITLESVSSLKDIQYSSYLKYTNDAVTVIQDYTPVLSTSFKGKPFNVNEEILSAIQEDEFLFECKSGILPPFIPDSLKEKNPKGFCLIPVHPGGDNQYTYLFLFVFFIQEINEMQSILPLLCRGIEVACAKIESINLLQKIKTLNESLAEEVNLKAKEFIKTSALLSSLIDSIPDLIFYKNMEGRYLGCNDAFCKFTGRSKEQIIGYSDYDFFDKDLADFFRKKDRQMLEKGAPARNEEWVTYPDASRVLLDTLKTPYNGPENEKLGLIGISRDITESKKTEEELLKIKKIESIGILAGGIAHDFNNILAAIMGNINLALYDEGLKENSRQLLSEAEKATLRAKDLTQQLLTFSKGGDPVKETSSLETIIKDSASFVLHGDKVSCKYSIPKSLWFVDIDKGQISQVIQNIVINASQAMPEGGVIEIVCENLLLTDQYILPDENITNCVKISIQDSGVGIQGKFIDKIFDPYFSTKQKGSGLGLSICLSIIKKHNGNILVTSSADGTTFDIYLPASEKSKKQKQITIKDNKISIKAKILVMDDDEMVRDVAKAMITKLGSEVIISGDGVEAVKIFKEAMRSNNPFDLVIMDLTIPGGMGGKEAVREIHKLDKKAKVIVSSGYSNDPIMANFQEYGFCAAIEKPFQLKDLSMVISQVLN